MLEQKQLQTQSQSIDSLFDISDKIYDLLIQNNYLDQSQIANKRLASILGPSRLNDEVLYAAIKNLQIYYNILQSAITESIDLKNSERLTRHWLNVNNLHISDKFFEYSNDQDVIIEVYNLLNVQCFRNISFMNICSYSLAELLLYSWPELFERSSKITEHCLQQIKNCIYEVAAIKVDAPTHLMKERYSQVGRVHEVTFKSLAPVLDDTGVLWGYVVSAVGTIKDKYPTRHELHFL